NRKSLQSDFPLASKKMILSTKTGNHHSSAALLTEEWSPDTMSTIGMTGPQKLLCIKLPYMTTVFNQSELWHEDA
ncbi:hypothetical protein, partial [Pseudomonas sp. GW531-T4]